MKVFVAFAVVLSVSGSGTGTWAVTDLPREWSEQPLAAGNVELPCDPLTPFQPADFTDPVRIDNEFFRLTPGIQFVLEGRSSTSGEPLPHKVLFTVTDLVKVVNGIRTRVVLDRDIQDGVISEAELAFFAQDRHGNVWSMGEYPEEYDDEGNLEGAPNTWLAGIDEAQPGVMMPGRIALGSPKYLQGYAPKIEFLDCAQIFETGQSVCVPKNCYKNVLVTDETSPLDSDSAHQRKFYAPRVGNVKITAVNDPEGETLVLTRVIRLGPQWVVHARKLALTLDRRGMRTNPVYKQTTPARRG